MTTETQTVEARRSDAARRPGAQLAAALLLALASTACGQLQRQGDASSYLIVNAVGGSVSSDVGPDAGAASAIAADVAEVSFALAMKDPGTAGSPTTPTTANYITVNQYRVRYIRTDGRNVEGVDVPFSFDGGMTVTVGTGEVTTVFTLVRHLAKNEAPLRALTVNGLVISTIAEVTFYGHDQTGREVSAVARYSIDFGNFRDPAAAVPPAVPAVSATGGRT
jgi:hypothetical protein